MTAEPVAVDEITDELESDTEFFVVGDPKEYLEEARMDRAIADAEASARVLAPRAREKTDSTSRAS